MLSFGFTRKERCDRNIVAMEEELHERTDGQPFRRAEHPSRSKNIVSEE